MTLDNGNVRKNSESDRRDFFNQQQHLANNIRKKRFKFCQKECVGLLYSLSWKSLFLIQTLLSKSSFN